MTTIRRLARAGRRSPEIVVTLDFPAGGVIGGLIMWALRGNPSVMLAAMVSLAAMWGIVVAVFRLEPRSRTNLALDDPPAPRADGPETGR